MQRRRFSREFKIEAVKLVRERGVSAAQGGRDLGVHENVLRKWVKEFGSDPVQAFPGHGQMKPEHPDLVKQTPITAAAWQIIVPIEATPRAPRSRIKIEFANVPAYDTKPVPVKARPGLVQVPDVILTAETANEILADKAVALTARKVLKYRDVWDVWYLQNMLNAKVDRDVVHKKFADYGTSNTDAKAERRLTELSKAATANAFSRRDETFLAGKASRPDHPSRPASFHSRRKRRST